MNLKFPSKSIADVIDNTVSDGSFTFVGMEDGELIFEMDTGERVIRNEEGNRRFA